MRESPDPPATSRTRRRVLLIEDNADAAESMQMLLQAWGHEVEAAPDGPTGIDKARRFRPEVVVCDIGIPGVLDGYEVARLLRRSPEARSAFMIALSGYGQAEDKRKAREAGFDTHVTKPADPGLLERLVRSRSAA